MSNSIQFKSNPNLKYKLDITFDNTKEGWNDTFEIFKSKKDNKDYLISPNSYNYNLDVFTLFDNKLIESLQGHKSKIRTVRYFSNRDEEYLTSGDEDYMLIVWDITNDYKIIHKIDVNGNIYSSLIIFHNNGAYLVTSTNSTSHDEYKAATKLYSLHDGKFIRLIKDTNYYFIQYLLPWLNKNDSNYYIIQFAKNAILVNNLLNDDVYSEFIQEPEDYHYGGCIINKENDEYLVSSSFNGYINIWDLYNKKIFRIINTDKCYLSSVTQWNNEYIIVADYDKKSLKIIDIEQNKIICNIKRQYSDRIISIKKVFHPIYGESLLSSSKDGVISLWTL